MGLSESQNADHINDISSETYRLVLCNSCPFSSSVHCNEHLKQTFDNIKEPAHGLGVKISITKVSLSLYISDPNKRLNLIWVIFIMVLVNSLHLTLQVPAPQSGQPQTTVDFCQQTVWESRRLLECVWPFCGASA